MIKYGGDLTKTSQEVCNCPLAFFIEVAISQIFPRFDGAKVHIIL